MKKLLLIINPMAGKSMYKEGLGEALSILASGGYETTVRFTEATGHAAKLAHELGEQFDVVACIGGDGTLSEVMEGIVNLERQPYIGYFPLGTANDVATTLKLPKSNIPAAAERIVNGNPMNFDLGTFGNDGNFTYVAAFGAFTDVSYATPQQEKQALGHFAYVLEGMMRLPRIANVHAKVEYDGGTVEDDFILGGLVNSTSVAGLIHLDPNKIRLNDGLFELTLVRLPRNITEMRQLLKDLINQDYTGPFFKIVPTSYAKFTFNKPVAWTRDGESGGEHTEIEFRNIRNAVKIIV
ncbi:MAG: diacylglycerol kinase family lipid kinase [Oscillospiraceae bacterium]|nr:diacylglycerol kinase family lipid kinase [Oscillospiraceae bacterium]